VSQVGRLDRRTPQCFPYVSGLPYPTPLLHASVELGWKYQGSALCGNGAAAQSGPLCPVRWRGLSPPLHLHYHARTYGRALAAPLWG
jgi:hypothetical protein